MAQFVIVIICTLVCAVVYLLHRLKKKNDLRRADARNLTRLANEAMEEHHFLNKKLTDLLDKPNYAREE